MTVRKNVIGLIPYLTVIVLPLVIGQLAGFAIAFRPWHWLDLQLPFTHMRSCSDPFPSTWRDAFFLGGLVLGLPLVPTSEKIWDRYFHGIWKWQMDREEALRARDAGPIGRKT